jgi:hypothetical protein
MKTIAIIAAILLGLGLIGGGAYLLRQGESRMAAQPRYEPARDATYPRAVKGARLGAYDPACHGPVARDDADLCAQWAAVEAVRDANRLTGMSIWITAAEFSALVASLFFTGWAAMAAAGAAKSTDASVRLAERTADRQLRPYVHLERIRVERRPVEGGGTRIHLTFAARNFGATPALDLRLQFARKMVDYPLAHDAADFDYGGFNEPRRIGPGSDRRSWITLSTLGHDKISGGRSAVLLKARVTYRLRTDSDEEDSDELLMIVDRRALHADLARAIKPSDYVTTKSPAPPLSGRSEPPRRGRSG